MRACIAGHSLIAGRLDPRLLPTWFLLWAALRAAGSAQQRKSPPPAVDRLGPEEIPEVCAQLCQPGEVVRQHGLELRQRLPRLPRWQRDRVTHGGGYQRHGQC